MKLSGNLSEFVNKIDDIKKDYLSSPRGQLETALCSVGIMDHQSISTMSDCWVNILMDTIKLAMAPGLATNLNVESILSDGKVGNALVTLIRETLSSLRESGDKNPKTRTWFSVLGAICVAADNKEYAKMRTILLLPMSRGTGDVGRTMALLNLAVDSDIVIEPNDIHVDDEVWHLDPDVTERLIVIGECVYLYDKHMVKK